MPAAKAKTGKTLLIVESPNKVRTLQSFLPSNYVIMASVGHITKIQDSGKYNMGIDVDNGFAPDYAVDSGKKDIVKQLKAAVKTADKVILASDPDNEGEAIAYHLRETLKLKDDQYERVTFHEITKNAVTEALKHPRKIDENKAQAAMSRAILDKIIGYRVSPVVMTKVSARSAGRVQSAALKILAMREDEIAAFVPKKYYELHLPFDVNGITYSAQYKGTDKKKMTSIPDEEIVDKIISDCDGGDYALKNIESKDRIIAAKPPFTTSTFQQEVSGKLGYSPKRAMECAQKLFEGIDIGGNHIALITYLRTDSTEMNSEFASALADFVKETYGEEYYQKVKVANKGKNVQDGHECLRVIDLSMTPAKLRTHILDSQLIKVYEIIYARTVASSMKDCIMSDTEYSICNGKHRFAYSKHKVKFDGYKKAYSAFDDAEEGGAYPDLPLGAKIDAGKIRVDEKTTSAPGRYTETSLVKKMDELGIGRPSTTANTIAVLEDPARGYTEKDGKTLKVTDKGMRLSKFLDGAFGDIINLTYTSEMESGLDQISEGKLDRLSFLTGFYAKLQSDIANARTMESMKPKAELVGRACPKCGKDLVYRAGRYGRFIACSGYSGKKGGCLYTERIPDPNHPVDPNAPAKPAPIKTGVMCPKCGKEIVIRTSSAGKQFYACSGFPKHKQIFTADEFKKLAGDQSVDPNSTDRD
jgi:DNA topoisomerase I